MRAKALSIVFSLVFIGIMALSALLPDNEISISERRLLKKMPALTAKKVINTEFMDEFDKYSMDQFPFRDGFRKIKAFSEIFLLCKMDSNGYFSSGGMLFKTLYPLNQEGLGYAVKNTNAVYSAYLEGTRCKAFFALVPDKGEYLPDSTGRLKIGYPAFASIIKEGLQNIQFIDLFPELGLESFFNTDLHWKQDALAPTASKIALAMGADIEEGYKENEAKGFKGVYASQFPLFSSSEPIIYLTSGAIEGSEVINYEAGTVGGVYDLEKLKGADMYSLFLSGAAPALEITNPAAPADKRLVIFRDSFASSLAPLFIPAYRTITLLDLRYMPSKNIASYVEFTDQDVLFLYSEGVLNNGALLR